MGIALAVLAGIVGGTVGWLLALRSRDAARRVLEMELAAANAQLCEHNHAGYFASAFVAVAAFFSRSSRIEPSGLKTHARRTAYVAQKRTMMISRERSGSCMSVRRASSPARVGTSRNGLEGGGATARKRALAGALSHSGVTGSNHGRAGRGPFRAFPCLP